MWDGKVADVPVGRVVHSGRRGSDGSVLTEVHWLGRAKGQKGKAVKVWNCVVVEETSTGVLPTEAKQL